MLFNGRVQKIERRSRHWSRSCRRCTRTSVFVFRAAIIHAATTVFPKAIPETARLYHGAGRAAAGFLNRVATRRENQYPKGLRKNARRPVQLECHEIRADQSLHSGIRAAIPDDGKLLRTVDDPRFAKRAFSPMRESSTDQESGKSHPQEIHCCLRSEDRVGAGVRSSCQNHHAAWCLDWEKAGRKSPVNYGADFPSSC